MTSTLQQGVVILAKSHINELLSQLDKEMVTLRSALPDVKANFGSFNQINTQNELTSSTGRYCSFVWIGLLPWNDFVNLFVSVSPSGLELVGELLEHFRIHFGMDLFQGRRSPDLRHHHFVRQ